MFYCELSDFLPILSGFSSISSGLQISVHYNRSINLIVTYVFHKFAACKSNMLVLIFDIETLKIIFSNHNLFISLS